MDHLLCKQYHCRRYGGLSRMFRERLESVLNIQWMFRLASKKPVAGRKLAKRCLVRTAYVQGNFRFCPVRFFIMLETPV